MNPSTDFEKLRKRIEIYRARSKLCMTRQELIAELKAIRKKSRGSDSFGPLSFILRELEGGRVFPFSTVYNVLILCGKRDLADRICKTDAI